jgi:hypothetical protein
MRWTFWNGLMLIVAALTAGIGLLWILDKIGIF